MLQPTSIHLSLACYLIKMDLVAVKSEVSERTELIESQFIVRRRVTYLRVTAVVSPHIGINYSYDA